MFRQLNIASQDGWSVLGPPNISLKSPLDKDKFPHMLAKYPLYSPE